MEHLKIRIDIPFSAQFDFHDPGNNSRELRTQALQTFLLTCGIELGHPIDDYQVSSFSGEDDGEFWLVKEGR